VSISSSHFECISNDKVQYLLFDYLADYKDIQVADDTSLPDKLVNFIRTNLFPVDNIVLVDRQKLGPNKYDRAEILSVAIPTANGNATTLNNALKAYCQNQSVVSKCGHIRVNKRRRTARVPDRERTRCARLYLEDSFAREICSGYEQTQVFRDYLISKPNFCSNCSFADAADKYYWFDQTMPFLPVWLTLISNDERRPLSVFDVTRPASLLWCVVSVASILLTGLPLIPLCPSAPSKVALPLMKAKTNPEDEQNNGDAQAERDSP
jgi:hypothetical protein